MTNLNLSIPRSGNAPLDQLMEKDMDEALYKVEGVLRRFGRQKKELEARLLAAKQESKMVGDLSRRLKHEQESLSARLASLQVAVPPDPGGNGYVGHAEPNDESLKAPFPTVCEPCSLGLVLADSFKVQPDTKSVIIHHEQPCHSVQFQPKSLMFASASWDSSVKLIDMETNSVLKSLVHQDPSVEGGTNGGLYSVAFAKSNPDILACTSADTYVYLWNTRSGVMTKRLVGHRDEVNGLDFHHVQNVMCTASDDGCAKIWDFAKGEELRTLDHRTEVVLDHQQRTRATPDDTVTVYGCTFMKAHEYLCATTTFRPEAKVWDIRDKASIARLVSHKDDVIGIDSPANTGTLLATGSDDGLVAVWDTRTWQPITSFDTRQKRSQEESWGANEVKRIAWSPCGTYLAAACSSNAVVVLKFVGGQLHLISDGSELPPQEGFGDCVFDVSWGVHPRTGKYMLAAASHDKSCKCWIQA